MFMFLPLNSFIFLSSLYNINNNQMYSRNQRGLLNQLDKNQNSSIIKKVIADALKPIQQRVYWLTTAQDESSFLQQYWQKQAEGDQILKKRLAKITQQKLTQLFAEVGQGKIQNNSQLQINVFDTLKLKELAEDVPVYDPNYFSANHPKTKEAKEKIKRIHEDQNRFMSKINKMKEKSLMKKMEENELRQKARESLEKEKQEKYREKVMSTLEETRKRKQYRDMQNKKFQEFLKAYKQTKPMHQLMEEEYKNKFQLPMLQQNKKKLAAFKAQTKPTLEEINEHEREYLQERQRRKSRVLIANHTIDVSFKSRFYIEEQRKLYDGEQYETIYDQMEKKRRYSELVKENFKPKISQNLRKSIAESALKTSFIKQAPDRSVIIEKGKHYLQFMRSLEKNRKHSSPQQITQSNSKINQSRYTNYLQEFKANNERLGQSRFSHDWQKQLRNKKIPEFERRERVLLKSKLLEEKAKMKEQFVSNAKYDKAEQILQRKREIDEAMIDSIRAKVAVLKDAQANP